MLWSVITKSDLVVQCTALLLIFASLMTWALIFYKTTVSLQLLRSTRQSILAFWEGNDFSDAVQKVQRKEPAGPAMMLIRQAVYSVQMIGVGSDVPLSERLDRTLRTTVHEWGGRLDAGMTLLATITSASPFVGLFGTVWGIYSALVGMSSHDQAGLLDKISGPVGEALVMTAAGLAVAIPALIAFNLLGRLHKMIKHDIEGFARDMQNYAEHNVEFLALVKVK